MLLSESYEPGTFIPYLILIFDLIKGMSWPLAVAVVAYFFSSELKDLIPRVSHVGKDGIVISPPHQVVPELKKVESVEPSDKLLKELSDPSAIVLEEENRRSLEAVTDGTKEDRLLRALTIQQMYFGFARAYADIFGSQIRALKELNSNGKTRSEAEAQFADLKKELPVFEKWSLDSYIKFLCDWNFIEEKNGRFEITLTGRNFLLYLVEFGLSEDRLN
ncbi:hypothetical protein DL239_19185 [Sedimentitalea sp. CY04]|uniref:Uncharacterized protein n=1 Tax=Parasedimentitalea denitrificans TaxID=2211118 RepID=A0ABX0WCX8_9RHOB|nr:hypothetical protein [Sedimentitalea sp. CY04]NIZ63093.1 hypothetical protein [Sedimentitalea sp. CY04]